MVDLDFLLALLSNELVCICFARYYYTFNVSLLDKFSWVTRIENFISIQSLFYVRFDVNILQDVRNTQIRDGLYVYMFKFITHMRE